MVCIEGGSIKCLQKKELGRFWNQAFLMLHPRVD